METILSLIEKYQSGSAEASAQILEQMTPLVKKYAAQIHCMEYEDALQELYIALLESLPYLNTNRKEGKCVNYMKATVVNRYYALCKQHLSVPTIEDLEASSSTLQAPPAFDETYYDVVSYINTLPNDSIKKILCMYFYEDKSDTEIAEKLQVSRQYVNRVKKKLITDYFSRA
ncbi:MAG: sigma-70 family RNA polymerase sigma factor [Eubacteriales bacterium]|nr:sigma-70 family RNA polymerase sigma factor [Eubacteriales bacterium]